MKAQDDNQAVIDTLIGWAAHPDDAVLEARAKKLIDQLFDDPGLSSQVSLLAAIREQVKRLPGLLKIQRQIEAELFSAKRLKEATTGELGHIWKLVNEQIAAHIAAAREGSEMDKPRFAKPQPSRRASLQLIAKPKGDHEHGNA